MQLALVRAFFPWRPMTVKALQEQILDDCDDRILDGSVPNQATARSQLVFDVGRVADALRHRAKEEGTQVSLGAAIYLSAVMEYISAEVTCRATRSSNPTAPTSR